MATPGGGQNRRNSFHLNGLYPFKLWFTDKVGLCGTSHVKQIGWPTEWILSLHKIYHCETPGHIYSESLIRLDRSPFDSNS